MSTLSEKDFDRFVLLHRASGGPKSPINVFEIGMAGKQIRIRHGTKGKKLGKSMLKKETAIEARNVFNDKRRQKIAEGYRIVKERTDPRMLQQQHSMTKENLMHNGNQQQIGNNNNNNNNNNYSDNDGSNISETSSVQRRKQQPPKRHHKPKKDGNVGNNKVNRRKKGKKVKNLNNNGNNNNKLIKNKNNKNNKLKNKNKNKKGKIKINNNNNNNDNDSIIVNGNNGKTENGIGNGFSHNSDNDGDTESSDGGSGGDDNDTSVNDEDYDSNEEENSSEYQQNSPKPYMNGRSKHGDVISDDDGRVTTTNKTENDDNENDNDNESENESGDDDDEDNSSSSSSSSSGRSSDDEYEMEYEKMAKIMADIVSREPPKKLFWKPLSMWIRYNEEIDYHAEWALAPMPRRIAGSCHELLVAYFRSSKGEFLTRLIKLARDPDEDNKHHFETERKVSQYLTRMAKIMNKCFHTRNDVCIWPVETIYFEYEDEMKWATVQAPFLPNDNYVFVKIEPNYGKPCVNDPIVGRYQHAFAAISKGLDLVRDWQGYGVSQSVFLKQCEITNVKEAIEQIVERKNGNDKKTQVLVMIDPVLTTCGAHYETNNPTDFGIKAIDEWLESHDCEKCRCDFFHLTKELRFGICDPTQKWFNLENAPKYVEIFVRQCRKELEIWDGSDDGWVPPMIESKEDIDDDNNNDTNAKNNANDDTINTNEKK